MRRFIILTLTILLTLSLTSCENREVREEAEWEEAWGKMQLPEKGKLSVRMDIKPIEPYGNQRNQQEYTSGVLAGDGWIYVLSADGNSGEIIKCRLDETDKKETIYGSEQESDPVSNITVSGDWIFFIEDEVFHIDSQVATLCKIKKDGSQKTRLALNVHAYILTEHEIYYEVEDGDAMEGGDWIAEPSIYVMSLDGKNQRKLLKTGNGLHGIDHGWVYYMNLADDCSLYRMKPDGTRKEKVVDVKMEDGQELETDFIVDEDQVYFVRRDKKDFEKYYLMKKTMKGNEEILTTFSISWTITCLLNKEGDWLYYVDGNKIYKIDVNQPERKKLIYQAEKKENGSDADSFEPDTIKVFDGDILLAGYDGPVYIKKDGTVINLDQSEDERSNENPSAPPLPKKGRT